MIFGEFSDYSLIDYQLCWNAPTADGIADFGSMPREKLDVVGCPRFDFAVAPMKEICMTRTQLCEMLNLDPARPIVTWASRFALAKMAYASPESRKAFDRQLEEIGYTQCVNRLGYQVQDHIDIYIRSLEKFLDAFSVSAKARPDTQFLFKPHPNDDVNYIEERLPQLPNVRLAVGVYIGDVLRGSDVLVNADCNTSVEAWVHGIPVVDAQLHTDYVAGRPDISAGNWIANEPEQVLALIDRGLSDPAIEPDILVARDKFIKTWYGDPDGRRCDSAARSLDRFLSSWSKRRKFYPFAYGGGVKHVAKNGVGWLLDVPGDVSLRQLHKVRLHNRSSMGTYDKVISRGDVRKLERQIAPVIASQAV
jgi:surface carbohydrate biosynthesis protein